MPKIAPSNEETEIRLGEIAREMASLDGRIVGEISPTIRSTLRDQLRALVKERHILQMRIRTRKARQTREDFEPKNPSSPSPAWLNWDVSFSSNVSSLILTNSPEAVGFQWIDYPLVKTLSTDEVQAARAKFKRTMAELVEDSAEREVDAYSNSLLAKGYQGRLIECPRCGCTDARLIDVKKRDADAKRRKKMVAAARLVSVETAFARVMRMVESGDASMEGLEYVSRSSGAKAKAAYRAQFLRIFLDAQLCRCSYADVNPAQKRGPTPKPRPGYCLLLPEDEGANCRRWRAVFASRTRKELMLWTHRQVVRGYRSGKEVLLASQEDEGQDSSGRARDQEADGGIGGGA